jgi:hypothetical protein
MSHPLEISEMNEDVIKVLARFVEIGQMWPIGSWVYRQYRNLDDVWYFVRNRYTDRMSNQISELEANQKGIFREIARTESYSICKLCRGLRAITSGGRCYCRG